METERAHHEDTSSRTKDAEKARSAVLPTTWIRNVDVGPVEVSPALREVARGFLRLSKARVRASRPCRSHPRRRAKAPAPARLEVSEVEKVVKQDLQMLALVDRRCLRKTR